MKNTIRKKWIITTVVFTAVLLLITAVFLLPGTKQLAEDTAAERIVAVNEVQQLIRRGEDEQASLKLQALKEKMQAGQTNEAVPSKKGTAVYSCIVFYSFLRLWDICITGFCAHLKNCRDLRKTLHRGILMCR